MKMSERINLRQLLFYTIAYLIPFFLVIAYDKLILSRLWYVAPGDCVTGNYGLGLNWLTFNPLAIFHLPMYSFQELFAIIIKFIGFPDDFVVTGYLQKFHDIGIIINIMILIATAIWFAYFAKLLELNIIAVFLCGLLVASMPAITIIITSWYAPNFTIGILLIPPAITILYAVKTGNFHLRSFFIALAVIGFCFSNHFSSMIVPVALIISIPISSYDKLNSVIGAGSEKFGIKILFVYLLHFAFIVDISVAIMYHPALFIIFRKHPIIISVVIILLSLVILLSMYYLKARKLLVANLIKYVSTPLLTGWALGANVLIPYWGISASKAFLYKGMADPRLPFTEVLRRFDIFYFAKQLWWNWIILFILLYGIVSCFRLLSKHNKTTKTIIFIHLAVTLTLLLNILIAMNVTMIGNTLITGNEVRYFVPMLFIIPIFVYYLFKIKPIGYKFIVCLLLVLSSLSFYEYVKYINVYNAETNALFIKADKIIDQHLDKYPNASIICKNTSVPERCAILLAFHNYRTPRSFDKLNLAGLSKHRIVYFHCTDENSKEAEFAKFIRTNKFIKPILVLPESYVIE
ncbi:MAG: hypothetical protein HQK92_02615 [Nitrospirae bacterium]|nr:hypothetical protein [Nitrospirota bacterium]